MRDMKIEEMSVDQIIGHLNMMFDWKRRPHEGRFLQTLFDKVKEQEEQIKNRDESLEKAREEIKWLRGMLKEQETRILSLGEAIKGENGLEIDPYVFVEIKGREDIFIGAVSDVSHYNYPNSIFDVGECFQINRSFPASKNYLNTDYMKTVRFWTHKPSKEQRKAVKWE